MGLLVVLGGCRSPERYPHAPGLPPQALIRLRHNAGDVEMSSNLRERHRSDVAGRGRSSFFCSPASLALIRQSPPTVRSRSSKRLKLSAGKHAVRTPLLRGSTSCMCMLAVECVCVLWLLPVFPLTAGRNQNPNRFSGGYFAVRTLCKPLLSRRPGLLCQSSRIYGCRNRLLPQSDELLRPLSRSSRRCWPDISHLGLAAGQRLDFTAKYIRRLV